MTLDNIVSQGIISQKLKDVLKQIDDHKEMKQKEKEKRLKEKQAKKEAQGEF